MSLSDKIAIFALVLGVINTLVIIFQYSKFHRDNLLRKQPILADLKGSILWSGDKENIPSEAKNGIEAPYREVNLSMRNAGEIKQTLFNFILTLNIGSAFSGEFEKYNDTGYTIKSFAVRSIDDRKGIVSEDPNIIVDARTYKSIKLRFYFSPDLSLAEDHIIGGDFSTALVEFGDLDGRKYSVSDFLYIQ